MSSRTNLKMAAYYLSAIALLLIYTHSTNAYDSTYSDSVPDIKKHLRAEKKGSSSRRSSDSVCDLEDYDKLRLCEEVATHLIREEKRDVLERFLGDGNLEAPLIADTNTLECKKLSVDDVGTFTPMFWCTSKRYKKTTSGSDIDQIGGFFCAGSATNNDRVYVFRARNKNARRVELVAELNNCTLGAGGNTWQSSGTDSPVNDVSVYRFGGDEPL